MTSYNHRAHSAQYIRLFQASPPRRVQLTTLLSAHESYGTGFGLRLLDSGTKSRGSLASTEASRIVRVYRVCEYRIGTALSLIHARSCPEHHPCVPLMRGLELRSSQNEPGDQRRMSVRRSPIRGARQASRCHRLIGRVFPALGRLMLRSEIRLSRRPWTLRRLTLAAHV